MKQSVLAAKLGYNQSYISQLENGERRFTDDVRARIEAEFGDITAYITDYPTTEPSEREWENNRCSDDNEEIKRLSSLLDAAMNEIEWLRGMVEKLSLR